MKTQYKFFVVLARDDRVWYFDTLKEAKEKAYSLVNLCWGTKATVSRLSYFLSYSNAGTTYTIGNYSREPSLRIKWRKGN